MPHKYYLTTILLNALHIEHSHCAFPFFFLIKSLSVIILVVVVNDWVINYKYMYHNKTVIFS